MYSIYNPAEIWYHAIDLQARRDETYSEYANNINETKQRLDRLFKRFKNCLNTQ